MADLVRERWDDWLDRQLANPDSAMRQIMSRGVSLDAAFLGVQLGRMYDQLLDLEVVLQPPEDDWRGTAP